jgi:hypothetical protein
LVAVVVEPSSSWTCYQEARCRELVELDSGDRVGTCYSASWLRTIAAILVVIAFGDHLRRVKNRVVVPQSSLVRLYEVVEIQRVHRVEDLLA